MARLSASRRCAVARARHLIHSGWPSFAIIELTGLPGYLVSKLRRPERYRRGMTVSPVAFDPWADPRMTESLRDRLAARGIHPPEEPRS